MALKVSVDSQHLILLGQPSGNQPDTSVDLPFMLRPELLHKADLAELFARKLAERLPSALHLSGPLVVRIPLDWGSVLLELPLAGLAELENPLSHLEWELERNAPESAHSYLLDYQDLAGSRVRLVAVRRPVEDFLCRSFAALGFGPVTFEVVDLKGQLWAFDPQRARALQEARGTERWKPAPMAVWLLPLVLASAAALLGAGWWLGVRENPATGSSARPIVDRLPVPAESLLTRADSLVQPALTSGTASTGVPNPESWDLLLAKLAAGENQLPSFIALHHDGILLNGTVDLTALLAPLDIAPTHAGREARWYSFAKPLPTPAGGAARHFSVTQLASLRDSLPAPVERVLLSRTRGGWRVAVQP